MRGRRHLGAAADLFFGRHFWSRDGTWTTNFYSGTKTGRCFVRRGERGREQNFVIRTFSRNFIIAGFGICFYFGVAFSALHGALADWCADDGVGLLARSARDLPAHCQRVFGARAVTSSSSIKGILARFRADSLSPFAHPLRGVLCLAPMRTELKP